MIQPYVVIVTDTRGDIRRKMYVLAESPGDANHWGDDWLDSLRSTASNESETLSLMGWSVESWPVGPNAGYGPRELDE